MIARVPLDEGALTGKIDEKTSFPAGDFRNDYFKGDRKKQVSEHVRLSSGTWGRREHNLAEIALRFCLSDPAVSTVIPGMRSVKNAEANCAVPDKGPLPPETVAILKRHAWDRNFYD